MMFFPQFSVFIRQFGDSVHHYAITSCMVFFLISLFLSDKLVTLHSIIVLLTLWYSFHSSLYLYQASWWLGSSLCYYFLYDIFPHFSVFIRQVGDSAQHYSITYFMIFFPQFSVFIRQVGASVHHYGITLWYSFLTSLYLSGKLVTLFIFMVLFYDILFSLLCIYQASWWLYSSLWYYFMIFFPRFSVFIRQVGDSVHHHGITLWYFFLTSLYLSGKLVTLFIIMVLLYDILSSFCLYLSGKSVTRFIIMVLFYDIFSSVHCIYQASWWLVSSLWHYFLYDIISINF